MQHPCAITSLRIECGVIPRLPPKVGTGQSPVPTGLANPPANATLFLFQRLFRPHELVCLGDDVVHFLQILCRDVIRGVSSITPIPTADPDRVAARPLPAIHANGDVVPCGTERPHEFRFLVVEIWKATSRTASLPTLWLKPSPDWPYGPERLPDAFNTVHCWFLQQLGLLPPLRSVCLRLALQLTSQRMLKRRG